MTEEISVITIITIVSVIFSIGLCLFGCRELEKKGYSFWGSVFITAAAIQPLGMLGAAFFVVGTSLLIPDKS